MESLKLTLVRKEVPVELEAVTGEVQNYVLRELTGKERDQFLNTMGSRVRYNNKGEPIGLKNFDGVQASLLCRCLHGPDGEKVSEATIQTFPATALNAMFEKAQELNALEEDSEDAEKKSEG